MQKSNLTEYVFECISFSTYLYAKVYPELGLLEKMQSTVEFGCRNHLQCIEY